MSKNLNFFVHGSSFVDEPSSIGAGAVVTKDIKDYALVVGNPAKQIGWVSEYGNRLNFDKEGLAICEFSNTHYKLQNDNVFKINPN
tara:strand:- start:598 stop:855 length:258 start_codon:yes stop_codon:yes gene_type:complete